MMDDIQPYTQGELEEKGWEFSEEFTPESHATLADRDMSDQHPISAISGLTEALAEAASTDHAALINRDLIDQHPISAISGLTEALAGAGTTDHSELTNRNIADQHPISAISGLTEALAEAGTTDHSELTNRDIIDQHPISAITGLSVQLDEVNSDISAVSGRVDAAEVEIASKVSLSGGIMTGALELSGDPTTVSMAANRGYVDSRISEIESKALVFVGFVSTGEPTIDVREGNLWYAADDFDVAFPWQVRTYTSGAWSVGTTDYTPIAMDLWSRLSDDAGKYYFGQTWNQIDFGGNVFNSVQFVVTGGTVSIAPGGISNIEIAANANIAQSKIANLAESLANAGTKDHSQLTNRNIADQHSITAITGLTDALAEAGTMDHSQLTNRNIADQHPISAISGLTDALAEAGTMDHSELTNRDAVDQHPVTAISGLSDTLDGKLDASQASNTFMHKTGNVTETISGKKVFEVGGAGAVSADEPGDLDFVVKAGVRTKIWELWNSFILLCNQVNSSFWVDTQGLCHGFNIFGTNPATFFTADTVTTVTINGITVPKASVRGVHFAREWEQVMPTIFTNFMSGYTADKFSVDFRPWQRAFRGATVTGLFRNSSNYFADITKLISLSDAYNGCTALTIINIGGQSITSNNPSGCFQGVQNVPTSMIIAGSQSLGDAFKATFPQLSEWSVVVTPVEADAYKVEPVYSREIRRGNNLGVQTSIFYTDDVIQLSRDDGSASGPVLKLINRSTSQIYVRGRIFAQYSASNTEVNNPFSYNVGAGTSATLVSIGANTQPSFITLNMGVYDTPSGNLHKNLEATIFRMNTDNPSGIQLWSKVTVW